jgi:hypothetical protein
MNFWETIAIATISAILTAGFAYTTTMIAVPKHKANQLNKSIH